MIDAHSAAVADVAFDIAAYSPWRPDARHYSGVLHAAFVFEKVCEFYRRYLRFRPSARIKDRYAQMAAQLHVTLDVLQSVDVNLSPNGKALLNHICTNIQGHAASSGCLLNEDIRSVLRSHVGKWLETNVAAQRPEGRYVSLLMGAAA